jgi:RNA polymerase sigma-70 factor (ECF subfamily)
MDFLEQHIIEKLKAGDGKSMEYIFNSYFKPLYNYACSLTRSDFEAEEIVSNVYLKLWENKESIMIETSIKSYLFKTTYHLFLDRQKHYEVVNKYKTSIPSIRFI